MTKEWKDVRVIANSGNPMWSGGAYTMAFVYSNKGNFLVKGYYKEVKEYLESEIKKGLKFVVNYTLWSRRPYTDEKHHRDIWNTSNRRTFLFEPDYKSRGNYKRRYKWRLDNSEKDTELILKRFPKRWIPEFDKVI